MRIDKVHIKSQFKNLNDFQIDIDENAWETVLLGLNATGKSNFLEALVIIFRDLDLEQEADFDYEIKYECRSHIIEISHHNGRGYNFTIDGNKLKAKSQFFKDKEIYLPKHVFVYYSGINNRMKDLFNPHLKKYYDRITKEEATYSEFKEIPRIFLVDNIHGSMALIALYLFKEREQETIEFLQEELGIKDFGSALFVIKKPGWAQESVGSDKFWGAKGLVRRFLEDLWLFSFAPIYNKERVPHNYKQSETQERWYLFIKDKGIFMDLKESKYTEKIDFFNALNSLEVSDLIHELHVNVIKKDDMDEVSNRELSEGEKQLLTVLGMLKFTNDEESLILLDEPDTHLNPMWKWKYLSYLNKVVNLKTTSHIIFCTHDPLVIGNLKKNQVQIFKRDFSGDKTETEEPRRDPKGLGVAGILTSDMFELPTTLDTETQALIDRRNELLYEESERQLTEEEEKELAEIYETLNSAGFNQIFKDPLYTKFVIAYQKHLKMEKDNIKVSTNIETDHSKAYDIVQKMIKQKK